MTFTYFELEDEKKYTSMISVLKIGTCEDDEIRMNRVDNLVIREKHCSRIIETFRYVPQLSDFVLSLGTHAADIY